MNYSFTSLLSGAANLDGQVPELKSITGWIKTHRRSKNVSFIELGDGSGPGGLQLVIPKGITSYDDMAAKLTTGAALEAQGFLQSSPGKGQTFEFVVEDIQLIGEADPELYPLQKKEQTLEFLRDNLHLRGRTTTLGASMRVRSQISFAIHEYFHEKGFFYLHSPIITTSDCEGAGEMFRVTTIDAAKPPLINQPGGSAHQGAVDYQQDFFAEPAHLTVSGQLEAETYALALGKVYTFGPTFRAENSNTTRHLAEFWMIEPEIAFADLTDDMLLAQDFIQTVLRRVLSRSEADLHFLHGREGVDPELAGALVKLTESPFVTLTYTEAIKILQDSGEKFEYKPDWGIDLQTEHERFLVDKYVKGPAFISNYPKDIKAFYMRLNDDGRTVAAMDLLLPRLGEVIGGSQREERLPILRERLLEIGLSEERYQWYLDLRRFGSAPHAGFGLGLERLVMYVTGLQNIRDVTAFPRFPGFARN